MHAFGQPKQQHSDDGFTLIEIMLVLTLIAILSSIAMPSLRGFAASSRVKSSARAIRDMLNFARDMAITERTAYLVVFDLDQNRYWLASSETFDVTDVSASAISTLSGTSRQAANQPATQLPGQGMVSRTGGMLGLPQKLNDNVSLPLMTTNHNFQPNQVNAGVDYIYFSPTGSSENTVVYLQDQQGRTMAITAESSTGRVRLQEIDSEQSEELGLSVASQH
jgi:type II secretion system protein H